MSEIKNRVLLLNVVGLTPGGIGENTPHIKRFVDEHVSRTLEPPLPAVTCSSQATMTTGSLPNEHGIVSNGWYFRELGDVKFWCRSDHLVGGEKIWEAAKQRDPSIRTANMFWRYCTHADCHITCMERPTYWANGRKGPDVYTEPAGLRDELVEKFGEFPLFRFWGPATSIESSRWIADATLHVMESQDPHLVLCYLPHLDYDVQKFGPDSPEAAAAHREVDAEAGKLIDKAKELGYDIAIVSEYGMTKVSKPVYLNRVLREAGYVRVQSAQNGELLEPGGSRAFAACSHQVAHVYVRHPEDLSKVKQLLESVDGVERVLDDVGKREFGLDHTRSGELIAIADPNAWFAYPYWLDDAKAPDFAHCVAIHDKPGHDPAEMFLGPKGKLHVIKRVVQMKLGIRVPFDVISLDATKIKGSHGRLPDCDKNRPVLLTTWDFEGDEHVPMTEVKGIVLKRMFHD
ncbi:MAG: alkaline phosphatase family protein [Planctomycetaceae bacterium]|nr:alkaline phosphatase family protein [Planctomycetaceae bacterium]